MTQPPFPGNDFFDQIDSVARNLTGNAYRLKRDDPTAPQKFTEFIAQSEQEFNATRPIPQVAQPTQIAQPARVFQDFEQGGFQQPGEMQFGVHRPESRYFQFRKEDRPESTNLIGQTIGKGIGPVAAELGRGTGAFGRWLGEAFEQQAYGSGGAGTELFSEHVGGKTPFDIAFKEARDSGMSMTDAFEAARGFDKQFDIGNEKTGYHGVSGFFRGVGDTLRGDLGVTEPYVREGGTRRPMFTVGLADLASEVVNPMTILPGVGETRLITAPAKQIPKIVSGTRAGAGAALRQAEQAAEAIGRTGVGNVLDPVPPGTVAGRAAGDVEPKFHTVHDEGVRARTRSERIADIAFGRQKKNYSEDIEIFADRIFREQSPEEARGALLGGDFTRFAAIPTANTPNLALGQGTNKGVLIEYTTEGLKGRPDLHSKPGLRFVAQESGEVELEIRNISNSELGRRAVSATIDPKVADKRELRILQRALKNSQRFDREVLPDGKIRYTPKQAVEEIAPSPRQPTAAAGGAGDVPLIREQDALAELNSKPWKFNSELEPIPSDVPVKGQITHAEQKRLLLESPNETETFYHATTPEGAREIIKSGEITSYDIQDGRHFRTYSDKMARSLGWGPGVSVSPDVPYGAKRAGGELGVPHVVLQFQLPKDKIASLVPEDNFRRHSEFLYHPGGDTKTPLKIDTSTIRIIGDSEAPGAVQGLKVPTTPVRQPTAAARGAGGVGQPVRVFHGTDQDAFDAFDINLAGTSTDEGFLGRGVYFSTDPNIGRTKTRTIQASINPKSPLRIEGDLSTPKQNLVQKALGLPEPLTGQALTDAVTARGFDSVILDYAPSGYPHQEIVLFDPSSAKLLGDIDDVTRSALRDRDAALARGEQPPPVDIPITPARQADAAAGVTPEQQAIIDDVGTGRPAGEIPVADGRAGGSGPPNMSNRPTLDAGEPEGSRSALFRPAPTLPAKDDPIVQRAYKAIRDTKPATEESLAALSKGRKSQIARGGRLARQAETFAEVGPAVQRGIAGEIPRPEFESIAPLFSPEDIESLLSRIWGRGSVLEFANETPGFINWRKFNADVAFKKLFHPDSAVLPTPSELELLERVYGPEIVRAVLSKKKLGDKAWDYFLDAWNLPRSLLSTADISSTLRQAGMLGPGNPKQFKDAFKLQLKAFANEEYALAARNKMEADPDFVRFTTKSGEMKDVGAPKSRYSLGQRLQITVLGEAGERARREEMFMTSLAGRLPIVRASERAYVTMLNELRFSVMKSMVEVAELTTGKAATDAQLDAIAEFINYATGRGSLWKAEGAAPLLNGLGFSPRLAVSRFQVPLTVLRRAPGVRKQVASNLVKYAGLGAMVLFLLDHTPGVDVVANPNSSDYGKIRIGKTRFDLFAGNLQMVRFLSQLVSGKKQAIGTRSESAANRADIVTRYLRTKAHPSLGFGIDVASEEDFLGEDFFLDPESFTKLDVRRNPVLRQVTPMVIQDIVEAYKESGPLMAVGAGVAGTLGVGVSSFSTPEDASQELWGEPITDVWPFQQKLAKDLFARTSERGPGVFDQADIKHYEAFQDIVEQFKSRDIDKRTAVNRYFSINTFYSGLRKGLPVGIFGGDLREEPVFPKAPSGGTDAEKAALQEYYDSSEPFESPSGLNSDEWAKVLKVLERKWQTEGTLQYVLANTHTRPVPQELLDLLKRSSRKTWNAIERSSKARAAYLEQLDKEQLATESTQRNLRPAAADNVIPTTEPTKPTWVGRQLGGQ